MTIKPLNLEVWFALKLIDYNTLDGPIFCNCSEVDVWAMLESVNDYTIPNQFVIAVDVP